MTAIPSARVAAAPGVAPASAARRPRRRWLPLLRPFPGHRLPRHLRPSQVHETAERLPGGSPIPPSKA